MAFLENLGKKVSVAAQAAAKKSGELVEITKLNVNINSEEDKIQKLYSQIGKAIYEKYNASGITDDEVAELCKTIAAHKENIQSLREKIAELKGTKQCIGCGAEMDRNQLFCSKCGTKNEAVPDSATAEEEQVQQPATVTCPACGAAINAGAAFCTNCGSKID